MRRIFLYFTSFIITITAAASFVSVSRAADTTPPVISNVRVENIIGSGAQIKWSTDDLSNSRVPYGIVAGNYFSLSDNSCAGGAGVSESVTSHCINLTALSYNTTYYFKVASRNADNYDTYYGECSFTSAPSYTGSASNVACTSGTSESYDPSRNLISGGGITTLPPAPPTRNIPSAPSNLTAAVAPNGIDVNLAWQDNATDEIEFRVSRRVSGGSWESRGTIGSNATSFTDFSVSAGTYDYYINACNSNGCSSDSNIATVTIAGQPPAAPSNEFKVDPVNSFPQNGAMGMNTRVRVRVKLTKEYDPNSTINQFFILAEAATPTSPVGGNFSMFPDSFEFIPSAPLKSNTQYVYKVLTSLKDKAGNPLVNEFNASFTTAPASVSTGTVTGKVLDSFGNPVAGAGINIYKKDYSQSYGMVADSAGAFKLDISAGTYLVEIFPPSGRTDLLKPVPSEFDILSGEIKVLTLQFTGVVKTITGKVAFSDGRAITDAEVGAYSKDTGQWTSTFTDSAGNFVLRVGGGIYEVGVRPLNSATAQWSYSGIFPVVDFVKDATAETKTVNFVIPVPDATLVTKTVDDLGRVLTRVGVVIDTASAAEQASVTKAPAEFRESDPSGTASIKLRAGTYYIRAFLPPELGFINPLEQKVSLSSGETRALNLVFSRREAISDFSASGLAKLSDGTPVDATIWAWSEGGRTAEARADTAGAFKLLLAPDRWHVGAAKEINGIPYKSSEIIVEGTGGESISIEIVLIQIRPTPIAPTVSVVQSATQQVVIQTQDGAQVSIPPSAAASSGNIVVEVKPTIEVPSQPGVKPIGTAYEVAVREALTQKEITQFSEEVEVRIPYSEKELAAQGVSEDGIIPSFFDESKGTWIKIENYTIDKDKNIVIARVTHLTRFAIVAAADITPPSAPTAVTASPLGQGKVKIIWNNPSRDFDHAKVYRSSVLGQLGEVRAAEVLGESFIDGEGLVNGVTYYYVVRAVDPAGNESANANQVGVKVIGTSPAQKIIAEPTPSPVLPPGQTVKLAILRNLTVGSEGDDVKALQELLLQEGVYPEGLITGYFGSLTKQAVIRFQEKYASEILAPVGLTKGNGLVGPFTKKKINELRGVPAGEKPVIPPGQALKAGILRNLTYGSQGDDVKTLQQFLLDEGVYPEGLITGYFGSLTKQAVIRFQEKYMEEILAPVGLTEGNGFVGPSTRKKIEEILKR